MTLEELQQHPSYQLLSPLQKNFLKTYIATSFDKVKTGHAMMTCRNNKSAATCSYKYLGLGKVQRVLSIFLEIPFKLEQDEVLALISERLRAEDTSTDNFLKLCSMWENFTEKELERKRLLSFKRGSKPAAIKRLDKAVLDAENLKPPISEEES